MKLLTSRNGLGPNVVFNTLLMGFATFCHSLMGSGPTAFSQEQASPIESAFLSNIRQLTFEGLRAGEGYFNSDGTLMVFQSERRPDNPFFQIYLVDLQTGDIEPISPGVGKTTCSWIHPNNNLVMFSSTHGDPEARAKQKAEIEFRESGKSRRYAWDYDPTFEIYAFDRQQKTYTQLTKAEGYDAEGCYSPDGKQIVFASNRAGYDPQAELTDEQRNRFEIDPSSFMDLYIMNADGSNIRRLTNSPGYDGGPFFSPDGLKICWRRFSEDGKSAEIFTMNVDGSNELQLTRMGALSWAPFFHPSGKYLIYNTNVHGFANFELYLVAADGKSLPVRVTDTDGFDGLASFTPDGKRLTWTSGRTAKKDSQIFTADWNHEGALQALIHSGVSPSPSPMTNGSTTTLENSSKSSNEDSRAHTGTATAVADKNLDADAFRAGQEAARQTKAGFEAADVNRHIEFLSSSDLGGRTTDSVGERKALSYVAGYLSQLGLKPGNGMESLFQSFDYPAEVSFDSNSRLVETFVGEEETSLQRGVDWNPLPMSGNLDSAKRPIVFAGFGIVAAEQNGQPAYDSYADLKVDVKDKWVLVFHSAPADVAPPRKAFLEFYGSLQNKLHFARERGALGLIVIDDVAARLGDGPVRGHASYQLGLAAIAVKQQVAEGWLSTAADTIGKLKDQLDKGEAVDPFEIPDLTLATKIEAQRSSAHGQRIIARLAPANAVGPAIMIGASLDQFGNALAGHATASQELPRGADSVSGVVGLLEIAHFLTSQVKENKLVPRQEVIFAIFPGHEQALNASAQYVQALAQPTSTDSEKKFEVQMDANGAILGKDQSAPIESLESTFTYLSENHPEYVIVVKSQVAPQPAHQEAVRQLALKCGITKIRFENGNTPVSTRPLNGVIHLDRIGRLDSKLLIQGTGNSPSWSSAIESRNVVAGLPVATFSDLMYLSDASSFQSAGIPVISAFTGPHSDSLAEDTPARINASGVASISQLMGLIARGLAGSDEQLAFVAPEPKIKRDARSGAGASLGTIPSYSSDVIGVKISDVRPGAPAQKAGLKPNDIIVELAGTEIEDIQAYSDLLAELPIGKETEVVVEREGKRLTFKITPVARQR
jgi:Tol biopolymer transport system component